MRTEGRCHLMPPERLTWNRLATTGVGQGAEQRTRGGRRCGKPGSFLRSSMHACPKDPAALLLGSRTRHPTKMAHGCSQQLL